MGLKFRILGPLEVVGGNGPIKLGGRRQRGVLAILLLRANQVVPVEQLADELYDGAPPATAAGQVRDHVSQLRKHLGAGGESLLQTRSPGYLLQVEPDAVDALRFGHMLDEASRELEQGEAQAAADRLRAALELWRGPALADFAYEPFAQPAIGRLEELKLAALERRIEADLRLGRDGTLVGELEELVAAHPLREQFRRQLMLALYRAGRQAEAVGSYHEGRRVLVDELGIEPSPELRELAGRILRQEPSLNGGNSADAAPDREIRNPYKGLHAFVEADAEDFFGREELVGELIERISRERFLAVVGPSGSGKSSVVLAGLAPAMRGRGWRIAVTTPGAYSVEAFDSGDGDGSELLLVVDQLEEVFTLVGSDDRRTNFLTSLERAVREPNSRVRVVATLRADFYDRPLLHREFAELMRGRVETVLPLSPDELERAIAGPARRVGVELEEGLLGRIVADVVDEPGALPLLQYALTELHERREGATLTLGAYAAIGGISGALAQRADALYQGFDTAGREAVRQLFLRLVTPGEAADTRRRVERAELESLDVDQGRLALAIDVFGVSRLLSFDRNPRTQTPTVEVAHEALLAVWARLRDWVAAARDDLRAHHRISAAAREWEDVDRDPSMLLRGAQLVRFESWAAESGLAQTQLEREYLRASVAAREAELAAEGSRRAREAALERRSVHRLRALVGVLAAAALVAAGLTIFAFEQSSRSKHQARVATARELAAASVANLDVDPELAVLLGLQAVDKTGGASRALPQAVEALHRAIEASRVVRTIRTRAASVVPSRAGSLLATAASGPVALWNRDSGRRVASLGRARSSFTAAAFSRDGSRIAGGGADGSATLWRTAGSARAVALPSPTGGAPVAGLAFSPDGTMLAADDGVNDVWVWDVLRRRVLWKVRGGHPFCGVAWSPDGRRFATGDCGTHFAGSAARLWDARTGRLVFAIPIQAGAIPKVDLSRDGRYLGAPNRAGYAQVWDLRAHRLVTTFRDHTGEVLAFAFSPDGRLAATSSTDGTARLWETLTGRQLLVLRGHRAPVVDVAFEPGGGKLITTSRDGTVRIWDVTARGSRDWLTLSAHAGGVESVYYSPDSKQLLTTGNVDGRTKLWDARTGALLSSSRHVLDPGVFFIGGSGYPPQVSATSPDGTLGAEVSKSDGALRLREAATGSVIATLGNHAQSAAFDWNGKRVAVGDADGRVEVWDVVSRPVRILRSFAAHNGFVDGVAFSPDGRLLATAGEDTTAALWDLRTGKQLLTLAGPRLFLTSIAFSPDGTRLVTGSQDGLVRVYVLPVDELGRVARSRLTRGWTGEECAQYLARGSCARRP